MLRERPAESELQIWRRRAKLAEADLADLRQGLRDLLARSDPAPPPPASSGKADAAARAAGKHANHIQHSGRKDGPE